MFKQSRKSRITALLLALVMLAALVPDLTPDFLTTEAEAIYHEDNAPAASLDLLRQTEDNFFVVGTGATFRIVNGKLYVWGPNTNYHLGLRSYKGAPTTSSTVVDTPTELTFRDEDTGAEGWGKDGNAKVVKVGGDAAGGYVMCLTDDGCMYAWGSNIYNYWNWGNGVYPYPRKIDTSKIPEDDKIVDYVGGSVGVSATTAKGNVYVLGASPYVAPICGINISTPVFQPTSESWTDKFQKSYALDETDNTWKVMNENERVGGSERRTIRKIYFAGQAYSAMYVLSDDSIWATGGSWSYYNFAAGVASTNRPIECLTQVGNEDWAAAQPQPDSILFISQLGLMLDAEGDVWAVGVDTVDTDTAGRRWNLVYQYDTSDYKEKQAGMVPRKIYDSTLTGSKCIKIFSSSVKSAVFLTEDNSIYAIGLNSNGFIDPTKNEKDPIFQPTQVFTQLSETDTITGIYSSSAGLMVLTKSGDQYFAGDNSSGAAGIGNTDNAAAGEVIQAIPPSLPPVQPLTSNELIFEVETADGVRYRYDPTQDNKNNPTGESVTKIDSNGEPSHVSRIELNAGSIVKLNVYFNDFGRMNYFELPIGFDPKYMQVVRGDGTAYESGKIVTPGSLGASTGIVKQFANSQWLGGVMVGENVKNGGYPKVCNEEGWVSVAGYTANKSAKINGEVKMFTVYFSAKENMSSREFDLFTLVNQNHIKKVGSFQGATGYDVGMAADDYGGCWGVSPLLENGELGRFDFVYNKDENGNMLSPAFHTSVTYVSGMSLAVLSVDGSPVKTGNYFFFVNEDDEPAEYKNASQISFDNKTATFTVQAKVTPDASAAKPASFPEVDWSISIELLPDGESYSSEFVPVGSGGGSSTGSSTGGEGGSTGGEGVETKRTYSDFITVVSSSTSQLKFKVNENYPAGIPCILQFKAKTQKPQPVSYAEANVSVIFRSFAPPAVVRIEEHDMLTDDTAIWTDLEAVDENKGEVGHTFHADFPSELPGFDQTAVVWTLMDKDRNVLTGLDSDCAKLLTPSLGTNNGYKKPLNEDDPNSMVEYEAPSVTVKLQHTTFGDDYLILRVESAYDGSIYDEIFLKIHQRVTGITWKKDKLYMLEGGDSVDLNSMITISPAEYYKADLEFKYIPCPDNDGSPFIYLSASTGKVQPLRVSKVGSNLVADKIYVVDKISGFSTEKNKDPSPKYLNVTVISVNSPIKAEDIEVHNLLGTKSDYATVYNLQAGDSVIFFKDYDTATGKVNGFGSTFSELQTQLNDLGPSNYKRFNNLTAEQIGSQKRYDFPLPDFLDGKGGDIGFMVLRKTNASDAEPVVRDIVPVHYLSDPSKVYGYVQLQGKNPASYQNRGISVKLVGPSTPATITTGANGYFVFQEYIIPGEYTMVLSKDGYLDRTIQPNAATGYRGIVITEALEFAISTYEDPILLYPGDMDNNGSINASDISNYVRNWYGQIDYLGIYDFAKYDFYDLDGKNAINMYDLNAVVTHNGWTKNNYAKWNVPNVS